MANEQAEEKKPHVKYLYIRVENSNPGHRGDPIACVASVLDGNTLRYALSVARRVGPNSSGWSDRVGMCVKSDAFDKELARKISLGKLQSPNPTRKLTVENDFGEQQDEEVVIWSRVNVSDRTAIGVTRALFKELSSAHHAPTHVRSAAQHWLKLHERRQKDEKNFADPEYGEYLRLKEKFEN